MPPYPEDKENVLEKLNEGARAAAMSEELEGYGNKRQTFDDRSVGEYSAGSGSADPPSNGFNSAPVGSCIDLYVHTLCAYVCFAITVDLNSSISNYQFI
jgi:hypothetical protein